MSRPRTVLATAVVYACVCIAILISTKPWMGGEGGISYVVMMNVISFPSGMIPTYALSLLSDMAAGTKYQWITATSPFWWLFVLFGCGIVGYGQWLLLSRLILRSNM